MHTTQNAVANHEYRSVPITALAESATNPRKRFDANSLEELAAYVPGHIIRLLWRRSFCGGVRQVARENACFTFQRAHNGDSRDLMYIRCCENPSRLSECTGRETNINPGRQSKIDSD
jgi:hypothetical protein